MAEDWCVSAKRREDDGSDGMWLRIKVRERSIMEINPCTTMFAIIMLFTLVIVCATLTGGEYCFAENATTHIIEKADCNPTSIYFGFWKVWVTQVWTWLYILSQDLWVFFAIYLVASRYGKIKLGPDNDPPEFNTWSWFAMIFSCGVASGLFFYCVAEPLWHYEPCPGSDTSNSGLGLNCKTGNRIATQPDNERAQNAIHLTLYHWGLHGWVCYAICGAVLALLHYRKGLPMTLKTCFYPLLGERIYGFGGDVLDAFAIAATTLGVCTSLGMGAMQINTVWKRFNGGENWGGFTPYFNANNVDDWSGRLEDFYDVWKDNSDQFKTENPWIDGDTGSIKIATAAAVGQVVTDNNQQIIIIAIITGISTLSLLSGVKYGIQTVGNVTFLLGMFLLWGVLMMDDTWYLCNLFVQSIGHYVQWLWQTSWYTGAFDQPEHSAPDGFQEYSTWMNDWTIFYWGWWIAWGPLVGTFLARISKGRTLREFIICVVFGATLFNFFWLVIFGGAALKMEMAAKKAGITCATNEPWYSQNVCRRIDNDIWSGEGHFFCSTLTRLSCYGWDSTPMLFALMEQYSSIGRFLAGTACLACALYFIASSDSGSLVDSMLASNGVNEPTHLVRLFWSLTEGISAIALLYTGRFMAHRPNAALKTLQAVSIAVGLPFTFIMCLLCLSTYRAFQYELGELPWGKGFQTSVVDYGITIYTPKPNKGLINWGLGTLSPKSFIDFWVNLAVPGVGLRHVWQGVVNKAPQKFSGRFAVLVQVWANLSFYLFILFRCLDYIEPDEDGFFFLGSTKGGPPNGKLDDTAKISTRYGLFHQWASSAKDGLDVSQPIDFDSDLQQTMGVGDRIGEAMHFSVFGWFFFWLFAGSITYTRYVVRSLYGIAGFFVEDFGAAACFYPNVIKQVCRHVDEFELPPEGSGQSAKEGQSATEGKVDSIFSCELPVAIAS